MGVPLHRLSLPAIAAVVAVTVGALLAAVVAVLAGSVAEVAHRLTLAGLAAAVAVADNDHRPTAGDPAGPRVRVRWPSWATNTPAGSGGAW